MKTRVTLVNPPYPRAELDIEDDWVRRHPPFPSLGLAYLAAVLEKNQYKVDIIDYITQSFLYEEPKKNIGTVNSNGFHFTFLRPTTFTYEDFRKEISKRQPDIVGITSTILTYKSALQIAKITKETHPNCLTVLGGPHATFWDDRALEECPYLDVVVRKEGEYTLLELAERIEKNRDYYDVLGITFRKNGEIVRNPDRPYIEDLDSLPFPAFHLWPIERLQKYGTLIFQTLTSRGCVHQCEFCLEVRLHGQKYRARSPKNVVDELEFFHKTYGAEYFTFVDVTFTLDQARTKKICDEIIRRKLNINWSCETRIDMVTKELLQKMRKAGCVSISYGVESGSQQILNAMNKKISLEQTVKVFKWTKEAGIKPLAMAVLGFPGETKETALETIKFVERLTPDYMGCYTIATPYPGTPLYNYVKEKGWLKITDFDKYDEATPTFDTPTLSMEELKEIFENIPRRFYLRPRRLLRMFTMKSVQCLSKAKNFSNLLKKM
ncbi:MAG: radical SAM protein [Candidatus Bathyarchaeia archaeon]